MKNLNKLLLRAAFLWLGTVSLNDAQAQCCGGHCHEIGNDLIVNGSFTNGNSGFTSGHTVASAPMNTKGTFGIFFNTNAANSGWDTCGDHTTGNGRMMVINGFAAVVWRQTISVLPNTKYCFSYHAMLANGASPPSISVRFNGQPGDHTNNMNGVSNCEWVQHIEDWWSGNSTSVIIEIVNGNDVFSGNDFALDDITFTGCIAKTPANAGRDTTICTGGKVTLPIPSQPFVGSYKVLAGDTTSTGFSGNIATPSVTSFYVLTVVDPENCCVNTDTIKITVKNCCKCPNTCFDHGPDRISNGTFSGGNLNFTSDYTFTSVDATPGQRYGVEDSSIEINPFWKKFGNPGNFLIVNGASSPNKTVWRQSKKVTKGSTYLLCFDHINLNDSNTVDPVITIKINGIPVDSVRPQEGAPWSLKSISWIANADSVKIEFFSKTNSLVGNDFGLDNIAFRQCLPKVADDTICDDEDYEFDLPEDENLTWSFKVLEGDMNSLFNGHFARPNATSTYMITIVDPENGCVMFDTVTLVVRHNCCGDACYSRGPEMVRNGDFSMGDTLFNSEYTQGSAHNADRYDVRSNSSTINTNWNKFGNPGNFFIGNGHQDGNKHAWGNTFDVQPNSSYIFCLDLINLNDDDAIDPRIIVVINGDTVLGPIVPDEDDNWERFSEIFHSKGASTANVRIISLDTNSGGNDFGIDNISFVKYTRKLQITPRKDDTICVGSAYGLVSPMIPLNGSYFYNILNPLPGGIFPLYQYILYPRKTTTIELQISDSNGCTVRDTFVIYVKCCYCDADDLPEGGNLVTNGNFNSGSTGFTSNYTPGGGTSSSGNYWIQPISTAVNPNWNKSGNTGNFLFANSSTTPGQYVWQQTITGIQTNTQYSFCMDIVNLQSLESTPNDPIIAVEINGTPLGAVTTVAESDGWVPVSYTWQSGSSTSATITVYSQSSQSVGNDFGIDNIGFKPCDEEIPGGENGGATNGGTEKLEVQKDQVNIYPNPASNDITVKLTDQKHNMQRIVITDITGKTVKTIFLKDMVKTFTVPVTELASGTYLITVYGSNGLIGKRIFIKEKLQR